ncbi:MAG: hypothetical protein K0Q79_370 [Flavipsychrobacter sp.]|jgi:hypothetical protein|nr:hypothetical protein [Flavipsychrobacter sp.]
MSKVTISITGHRSLTAEQIAKVKPVMKRAIQNIIFTAREHDPEAEFTALCPLAEGADTIFANIALLMEVPLKLILPFEVDEYLKGFSNDEVRQEFYEVYNKVDKANISTAGHKTSEEVNELYLTMGKKLVEQTDYLIAVWNGKAGQGKGGTGDIVAYAIEKKKDILIINPEDKQPHINYLHHEHYKRPGDREIIDIADTNHLLKYIEEKQREYDANAMLYNHKYKRIWTMGFVIGLVEVLAFSLYLSFHIAHTLMATIEFLCILTIVLLLIFGKAKKWHSGYVHYRIVSERLRIKKFFAELGLRIYHTSVSPIYFSFKEKPEYHILDNTIKLINLSAWSYLPFKEKKKRLQEELLVDQHKYHERKMEKFEKKNNLYKKVREILFIMVALAVTLHFLHALHLWDPAFFHAAWFEPVIIFICMFFPATIAAAEALKYLYEWEKIITLAAAMSGYFKEREKKLAHVHTEEELEVFLNGINKDMLIENLDWEKYMHDKNEVPT